MKISRVVVLSLISSAVGDVELDCIVDIDMNVVVMVYVGMGAGVMSGCDEWSWTPAHVTLC